MNTRTRAVLSTVVTAATLTSLSACTSGPSADISCAKYAALTDSDQDKAAVNVLKKKGLDTVQDVLAEMDLEDWCRIIDGKATAHESDPISSDPDISS